MKIKLLNLVVVLVTVFSLISCGQNTENVKLKNDVDSVSYMIGIFYGKVIKDQNQFGELNSAAMMKGIDEVYSGEEQSVNDQEISMYLNMYFSKRAAADKLKYLEEGQKFLEENKTKSGVVTTASGLQYKIIRPGSGISASMGDSVVCNYKGTLINGDQFDSSEDHGGPQTMVVGSVIEGWNEALQMMKEGAKWELYIPTNLAYGDRVRPGGPIKPNMALIFEIEVIKVKKSN